MTGATGATGATGEMGPSNMMVYRANLSTANSSLNVPLGNLINYRVAYVNANDLSLTLLPGDGYASVFCDYKMASQYLNGVLVGWDIHQANNAQILPNASPIDTQIYNTTQEMHKTWIRIRHPDNETLWSMYEVNLFPSQNGGRVIVWVFTIDEGGTY